MKEKRLTLLIALLPFVALLVSQCGGSGNASSAVHRAGANCTQNGCHDGEGARWSATLHAASPSDVLTNTAHNSSEQLINECIQCHAPFQAKTFSIGYFVQPVNMTGPWHVVDEHASTWQAIKCETCHDPSSNAPAKLAFFDPTVKAYVSVQSTTELCEKCHQAGTDDSRDLKGSVHESLQCTSCHFQPGSQMSLSPKDACVRCHSLFSDGRHVDVTKFDTTYANPNSAHNIHFLTCTTCHK
ncbi:MAG: cytochrome c3 family protein [Fimbriimonadales bacterium]